MTARLLAALALVVVGLVLPASPATACSCVGLETVLEQEPEVAFVGVLRRQKADDSKVINRFAVKSVHAGEVHAVQDVVSPVDSSCGVDWSDGAKVLVLGRLDDEQRIATDLCTSAVEGAEGYDDALAALGEGTEPLAGSDVVERDGFFRRDHLWIRLVVGVVGLAGMAVLAARWLRSRRRA